MRLTVREAAQSLQVPEEMVYKWIRESGLPAVRLNEQYRLNRVELAEWAQANLVTLLPEPPAKHSRPFPRLAEALAAGGVHRDVRGRNPREALRAVVEKLRLPPAVDREFLFEMLMVREDQGSTAFGDGIAIPHVRNPIVLRIQSPSVTLCFLETPVDFGAVDKEPVSALFTMVNPTIRVHLHLLSRLAFCLKSPSLLRLLKERAGEDEILAEVRVVEAALDLSRSETPKQ